MGKMNMNYTNPQMEVVEFKNNDVICTSGLGTNTDNFQDNTTTVPEIDAGGEFQRKGE